ncbi:MAG: hypothetical protein QM771_18440 [Nitrospira sp.]
MDTLQRTQREARLSAFFVRAQGRWQIAGRDNLSFEGQAIRDMGIVSEAGREGTLDGSFIVREETGGIGFAGNNGMTQSRSEPPVKEPGPQPPPEKEPPDDPPPQKDPPADDPPIQDPDDGNSPITLEVPQ